MQSLIRAFASHLKFLWPLSYLEFLSLKEAAQACLSLHLSICHIVGNLMLCLKYRCILTLKVPITTAVDDKFCNIFPNFQKK